MSPGGRICGTSIHPYSLGQLFPFADRPDIGLPIVWHPVPNTRENIPLSPFSEHNFDIHGGWEPLGVTADAPDVKKYTKWRPPDLGLTPLRGTAKQWHDGVLYSDYVSGNLTPVPSNEWSEGPECDMSLGARVRQTTPQTLPVNSQRNITFGAASFDTSGYWPGSSGPTSLTVPAGMGGLYHIAGTVLLEKTSAPPLNLERIYRGAIVLNGTLEIANVVLDWSNPAFADGNFNPAVNLSCGYQLADGDTLQLRVQWRYPGSGNVTGTGTVVIGQQASHLSLIRTGQPCP